MTWLYCEEAPELVLGPDPATAIRFHGSFAEISRDDPAYATVLGWVASTTNIHIENLGDERAGLVAEDTPDASVCSICGKAFASPKALRGHLISHRPGT